MNILQRDLYEMSRSDYIDGEDLEKRLEDIEDEIMDPDGETIMVGADQDLVAERQKLIEIIDEIEGYAEDKVRHTYLYADHYFPAYAEEFAYDIGAAQRESSWPPIDWAKAAEQLKQDYTSIEIEGREFWYR
ncbi:MAG TPA: hypothetical protein VFX15_03195 [Actinomycetes bacterium]|nr:hypothetical protein [Actinomycetes bacterium]